MKKFIYILSLITGISLSNSIYANDPNYYRWNAVLMNSGAPNPASQSFEFGYGNLYYANSSNLITILWNNGSGWSNTDVTGINTVKQDAPFTFGDWKMFYISSDNRIRALLYSNWVYSSPELNIGADPASGAALVYADPITVFYLNTNNKICYLKWNGLVWAFTNTNISAKPGSNFVYGNGNLFYINPSSNAVDYLYNSGGNWINGGVVSNSAAYARGDGMVYGGTNEVFYIDITGNISRLYKDGTWQSEQIKLTRRITDPDARKLAYDQGRVFYVSSFMVPTILVKDRCQWYESHLENSVSIYPYKVLAFGAGKLFGIFNSKVHSMEPSIVAGHPYPYIKAKSFYVNGTQFYPKVANYIATAVSTDGGTTFWPEPYGNYRNFHFTNPTLASNQLAADFAQMVNAGFNCIRLMGLTVKHNPANLNDHNPYGEVIINNVMQLQQTNPTFNPKYFGVMKNVLDLAGAAGLKVILCTGQGFLATTQSTANYVGYLNALSAYSGINTHTSLLAYDLYNEPDVMHAIPGCSTFNPCSTDPNVVGNKASVCQTSKDMFDAVRTYDQNHLITIGTLGLGSIHTWDPGILSCDFYSFHYYDRDPTQKNMQQAFFWNKENLRDRPWIIGETGYSAINSVLETCPNACSNTTDGTEAQQSTFVANTQTWTSASGGSGYSYWQYHDVCGWGAYEENYGLISRCENVKPAFNQFNKNFLDLDIYPCNTFAQPSGYYNEGPKTYTVTGTLVNEISEPIPGGQIYQWINPDGNKYTYTRADGTFSFVVSGAPQSIYVTAMGREYKNVVVPVGSWVNNVSYMGPITVNSIGCTWPRGTMKLMQVQKENAIESGISIFPNPTNGNYTLDFKKDNEYIISIYNIAGQLIDKILFTGKHYEGALTDYKQGLYLVKIESRDQTVHRTVKLIKE